MYNKYKKRGKDKKKINKKYFKKSIDNKIIIVYNNYSKERGVIIMNLQVTLFATNGKYRPISTVIRVENLKDYVNNKAKYQKKAIENICHNRKTDWNTLKRQSYTTVKVREYNIEKINQQTKANLIKKLYENYQKKVDNSEF